MLRKNLPTALYDLVPALFPHIMQAFLNCDISPAELFALAYVRHHGHGPPQRRIILRSELVKALEPMLHDKRSETARSDFISDLANAKLLSKASLTDEEKRQYYGDSAGRKDAVV